MTLLLLPLLLSEVLANEPGSATSLEFVELAARHPVQEGFLTFDANGHTVTVPAMPLDSGGFLVICRDAARFEEHFGDSSGTWGDDERESYPIQEFGLSLPNGSGYVSLSDGVETDRFQWTGKANDGQSYERVSDSLWQLTDPSVGSTPGRRNTGELPQFDWAVGLVAVSPALPRSGEPAELAIEISNAGQSASSGSLVVIGPGADTLLVYNYAGLPGQHVTVRVPLVPIPGLNVITLALSSDERPENGFVQWSFYADSGPVVLSEFFAAPPAGLPEWIEIYSASGIEVDLASMSLADLSDTVLLPSLGAIPAAASYLVITEDSSALMLAYPELIAPVVELKRWPALNNDGDTLALLLHGTVIDRCGYPSVASRRGVSYERVGTSNQWAWCIAQHGATPGNPNSVDVSYSDDIELNIAPNPFAAALGEQARFQYQVPFGSEGELRLFRGDGKPVRTLFKRQPVVSGEVYWDGAGDEGGLVPVGIYIARFKLFRPAERVHLSTVVVAR